jgi:hypothetical protein
MKGLLSNEISIPAMLWVWILASAAKDFPQHLQENMGKYWSRTTYLKMGDHPFVTYPCKCKSNHFRSCANNVVEKNTDYEA